MTHAYSKIIGQLGIGLLGWFGLALCANAQMFAGKREIERQSRVQWLSLKRHTAIIDTPGVVERVDCVAQSIFNILPAEAEAFDWEVVVFEDDTINAFALPIGKIGIHSGLLEIIETPDELAAVIGHEVAHVLNDHVMSRLRRQRRSDALVLLGSAATGLGGMINDASNMLFGLRFSREQETEADLVGLEYMAEAGFDPRGVLDMLQGLEDAKDRRSSHWFSDHPTGPQRRHDAVQALVPALIRYNAVREAGRAPNCY